MSEPVPTAVGFTWWFTGLPGAGKTTLAQALAQALRERGQPCCVLDGDEVRKGLCHGLGFSLEARHENMRRVAEVARLLNAQGVNAAVALISPTAAIRAAARQIVGPESFREVHVSTPLAVCQARDPKGLYARAAKDASLALTGVQAEYEVPLAPALRLDTQHRTVSDCLPALLGLLSTPSNTPRP